MSQQLVKKGANGRHDNVMPKSWIDAIKDKYTGQSLLEILQGFNCYFLSYTGDVFSTRLQVPRNLRKKGLWITYIDYNDNLYSERYISSNIDDTSWSNSINWEFFEGADVAIHNNPDYEDLTVTRIEAVECLKFKDRDTSKGKGYIILRTGKSLAEQMVQENTIYEVRYDFDLGDGALEIPANCTLDFKGGSFNNGVVVFNGTEFRNPKFKNCTFSGTTNCNDFNIDDFGAIANDSSFDNSDIINQLIKLQSNDEKAPKTIFVPKGTYYIKKSIYLFNFYNVHVTIKGTGDWSVISQLTDNIPIIKHYETNHVEDIRIQYATRQSKNNTNAIALASQRMVFSEYKNIVVRNANKGIGFISKAEQASENIVDGLIDQCHVNAVFRNIRIYASSEYAIDFSKEISQADSGSVYDNIYISSRDWLGDGADYVSKGAILTHGTSAIFTELNIEGDNYSDALIKTNSIINNIDIGNLHIEGLKPMKPMLWMAGQTYVNISSVHIDRCSFDSAYMNLIYSETVNFCNIGTLVVSESCTQSDIWYLSASYSTTHINVGFIKTPTDVAPQVYNNSPLKTKLTHSHNSIMDVQQYQNVTEYAKKYNWVIDSSLNELSAFYQKVLYKDGKNNIRYPNGHLAIYNGNNVLISGPTSKRPDLTSEASNINVGSKYFDTDLNMEITWTGSSWNVDGIDNVFIVCYLKADNVPILVHPSKWYQYHNSGEIPSGILVREGNKELIVSLTKVNRPFSSSAILGGGTATIDRKEAFKDWNGETNAEQQLTHVEMNTEEYAQGYCATYQSVNSNGVGLNAGKWRLPSVGELMMIYSNKSKIDFALSLIDGATTLGNTAHVSSTEYDQTYVWVLSLYEGGLSNYDKTSSLSVRPVTIYQ